MNRAHVDRIAAAVLYEGYILYPYRPSVKNRQRWTFGGLYPEAYCRAQRGSEASSNQTQVLLRGNDDTTVEVTVRFLHLTARQVGAFIPPLERWQAGIEPPFQPVESLHVGGQLFQSWQEAQEREISTGGIGVETILACPCFRIFSFPGKRWLEPLTDLHGLIPGVLARAQYSLRGLIELRAIPVAHNLFKLSVQVLNRTVADGNLSRDQGLLRSLISAHTILEVHEGDFISLLDPPETYREAAALCRNVGTWPVLVGEPRQTDTVLSSPIILYDYPQVAAESPGDLFDGTEINEILTLRVLALTDDEKQQISAVDSRARSLLERTESLGADQIMRLHGSVRPLTEGDQA
jgi:hydrogenase maturation protease